MGSWNTALDFSLQRLPLSNTLERETGTGVGSKDEVWAFGSLGYKLRAMFADPGEVRVGGLPCRSFMKMLIFAVAWCIIYHFDQFNKNKFVVLF